MLTNRFFYLSVCHENCPFHMIYFPFEQHLPSKLSVKTSSMAEIKDTNGVQNLKREREEL